MNLSNIEVFHFNCDISIHFIDINVAVTREQALLIEFRLIDMSELNVFVHELSDLIGFINISLDVFHLLMEEFNLLIGFYLVFVLFL